MFGKKGVKTKYSLRSPQLEYTRFPWAANEPPRATLYGVSSRPFLPQESRIFQLLGWFAFTKVCFTFLIHPSQFHSTLIYSSSEI